MNNSFILTVMVSTTTKATMAIFLAEDNHHPAEHGCSFEAVDDVLDLLYVIVTRKRGVELNFFSMEWKTILRKVASSICSP